MSFKPPQAGELVHWARIERFEQTGTDGNGQPVGSWQLVTHAYVKREGLSGRILEIARQNYEAATHNIYFRYHPQVTRNHRVVIGFTAYDIGWLDHEGVTWTRATTEESWPGDLQVGQLLNEEGGCIALENGGCIALEGSDNPDPTALHANALTESGRQLGFEDSTRWLLEDDATTRGMP